MINDTGDTITAGAMLPGPAPARGALAVLHEDLERAADYKKAAHAEATHRAYASDWRIYGTWCEARGLRPMPAHPEQITALVANQAHAGARASTVERRVAAIGHHHRAANYPAPGAHPEAGGLREAMAGIRRARAERTTRKDAADVAALRQMLAEVKNGLRGLRDRALCRR